MRKAFLRALQQLAASDERVMLLTGDLGFMVVEEFAAAFPQRFLNVGVAEQNMFGIAAGLARAGKIPFVYSISTFASMRGYEFFRNGAVLHRLPIRIVSVGGGFEYGLQGHTHHALEDLALMRCQPGVEVYVPSDAPQAGQILAATAFRPAPIYYRLGKDDRLHIPELPRELRIGQAQVLRDSGNEAAILLLAIGSITTEALRAADLLAKDGKKVDVAVLPTLAPVDSVSLTQLLSRYQHVIAVEEHYATGGLGSLVAEVIAEERLPIRLHRAAPRTFCTEKLGSQAYLREQFAVDAPALAALANKILR